MQVLHAYGKRRIMGIISVSKLLVLLNLYLFCLKFGIAVDTITSSKSIRDPESLTSNNGVFRLGFFSLANSTDRYVGIWYNNKGIPEESVIWVANRNKPLKDDSGVFMISEDGNLIISDGHDEILWSSNVRNPTVLNVTAQILDSGNLVLRDNDTADGVIWESFQQPSNVFMPTMKISKNVRTGEKVQVVSWKSTSDPSNGSFSLGLEPFNIPQAFIWNNSRPYWRSGPWSGRQSLAGVGAPNTNSSFVLDGLNLVSDNEGTFSLSFSFSDNSYLSAFKLNPQGTIALHYWDDENKDWISAQSLPETECDVYGKCGAFGSCDAQKPSICSCLSGFEPKNKEEWKRGNWTNGCVRVKPLGCERIRSNGGGEAGKEDRFVELERMKVPDFAEWSGNLVEEECKERCLNNCSCIAYSYDADIGCMSWSKELIDIQKFTDRGINLYIRLAPSDKKKKTMIIIITVAIGITIIIAISIFFLLRWMAKDTAMTQKREQRPLFRKRGVQAKFSGDDKLEDKRKEVELHQLPIFKFEELATATINFELSNKLGEGGFGPVYRGKLQDGKEIAVKRLSRASGQGFEELTNEVKVNSELQHRNLVRLLGCCIEREEKMLVYEYMPNKSLDAFLFDPAKQKLLDWKKRFNIIQGISRGLLYLHRDSRLRIIHRDLKASNILLDEEMNPKISDFGMARIFGVNENQASTRRVVGTYGYMAPEYAMEGHFSEKSDVFSYGVLLLEIISGRRNTSFYSDKHPFNLVGYAWKLWTEDNILALADIEVVSEQSYNQEIMRCIHVGLLCIQEFAKDRPTISTVISMLNSEIVDLPTPKQPAFIEKQISSDSESLEINQSRYSINDVTVSKVEGR